MDLVLNERRGAVLILQLNRPSVLNALDLRLVRGIRAAIAGAQREEGVRAIVLTGGDGVFSVGADISMLNEMRIEEVSNFIEEVASMLLEVSSAPVVTVAAVEGYAVGAGADLAVACDVRVAGQGSKFRFPGMSFGVVLGTRALARLVGPARAKEIVFGQMTVSGEQGEQLGLVNRVVPAGEAKRCAVELATQMAEIPGHAVGIAKTLLGDAGREDVSAAVRSVREGDFAQHFAAYRARQRDKSST